MTAAASTRFASTTSGVEWRVCFAWREGDAWNVEIVDYHWGIHMSISREDVDRRAVDYADVTSGRRLPPVHPGRFLRDEFLEPLDLSVYALARALNVPRPRLNDVVRGRRSVTTDTALRLARYFGTSPEFWINLQARYDLDVAERALRRTIDNQVKPRVDREAHVASTSV